MIQRNMYIDEKYTYIYSTTFANFYSLCLDKKIWYSDIIICNNTGIVIKNKYGEIGVSDTDTKLKKAYLVTVEELGKNIDVKA